MRVHLVDGTYELFRQFYAPRPGHRDADGTEVGATRAVVASMLALLEDGATHVGVATDQVIESFRNDLWPGYKSGAGLDPLLEAQFPLLEDALAELGVAVWAMVDYEADDALASAAFLASADPRVEQVVICTPDKDLGQCVGGKVVQLDRRRDKTLDAEAVREKFGVPPASIPDWLALVGDSADGFPGLPGWGAKTAAAVLSRYGRLEEIPDDPNAWDLPGLRGRERLAETLRTSRELAGLFKDLATLRSDADVGRLDDWEWNGALPGFEAWSVRAGLPGLAARAERLQRDRT